MHKSGPLWCVVAGFNAYEVSNTGLVRRIHASTHIPAGGLLSQVNLKGYPAVSLFNEAGKKLVKVHRLVASAFLPPPLPDQTHIAHSDGNPLNNSHQNLRWATCADNLSDRVTHLTEMRGAKNGRVKLTAEQVLSIRARYKKRHPVDGAAAMAAEFGVSDVAVIKAFRGENWSQLSS